MRKWTTKMLEVKIKKKAKTKIRREEKLVCMKILIETEMRIESGKR